MLLDHDTSNLSGSWGRDGGAVSRSGDDGLRLVGSPPDAGN